MAQQGDQVEVDAQAAIQKLASTLNKLIARLENAGWCQISLKSNVLLIR